MSKKIAPSPIIPEGQQPKKLPLGSVNRQLVENCALPQPANTEVKKPIKGMHTVPFTSSAPISQSEVSSNSGKLEDNMAVSQEVVTAAMKPEQKAVVTPEGAKGAVDQDPVGAESGNVSPPLTPPRVTSVLSKENVEHPTISPPQGLLTVTTTSNRSRIHSLDRGSVSKSTIGGSTQSASSNEDDSSQGDSSDGESSYFAKHLPSPKSGRRFSYSSNHSAPARTSTSSSFFQAANNKPSDASLSFSDESDDDDLPGSESPEPVAMLPSQAPDMQLQRITRVHSVSSLVSSDASQSHPQAGVLSPESSLSKDSSANCNGELSTVRASSNKKSKSLAMPNEAFSGAYYGPPPAILPGYNAAGPVLQGMLHPQPQMMTADQLSHWAAAQQFQHHNKMYGGSKSSDGAVPFVYSDDETDDSPFMHHLAGNGQVPDGLYNTFSNGGGGGSGGTGGGGERQNGSSGGGGGGGANGANNSGGGYEQSEGQGYYGSADNGGFGKKGNGGAGGGGDDNSDSDSEVDEDFQVYWQRWIMLFYMSMLNLLSDWTCYSVAPIAILTQETFGDIDPERLVVIFLGANAVATAMEPIILARLGLKKTVLFGSLLLMLGSMVKSGGIPPIIQAELHKGEDEWRLNFGFFLVGLSQPLYQCTPALLSASWFPERERTMATGVALNANQLGIGCAFIFGTLLVAESDDIPGYFGLLSVISTLAFLGTLFQFDDAPPTPPSSSAKVMKGDFTVPDMGSIIQSVRKMSARNVTSDVTKNSGARRRAPAPRAGAPAPSPASRESAVVDPLLKPSPMMPGGVRQLGSDGEQSPLYDETNGPPNGGMLQGEHPGEYPSMYPGMPYGAFPPPPNYQKNPYFDPRVQQQPYYQHQPQFYPPPPHPYYYGYQNAPPPTGMYPPPMGFPGAYGYPVDLDEGAEPVVTISDHHLDIDIRDDQIILSTRACLSRPGFIHALVTFTISGIVINTLSTYMDYLVTLNGAGREYVGIVGGSFQFIIMISSLVIGKQTDKTRAYYTVIISMLVLGAFGLAECGVSLDADRGSDLRWSLLIVAALVGPLQPVSTELGVDVAYPLSENTVLVIQQLFSNLLSALFIPLFKSLRDIGISRGGGASDERPQYTFSFYLLIVLHAAATIFFASFNGRYLRYEHELQKQAKNEQKKLKAAAAFHPIQGANYTGAGECQPLTSQIH